MSEYVGKWITTQEAAEIIGVGRKAVAKAARKGNIKAHRNRMGEWMVEASSVEAYKNSPRRSKQPRPEADETATLLPIGVTIPPAACNIQDSDDNEWLLRAVSLMTPDEARNLARKVLEATVPDPAARLLIERHI